MPEATYQVTIRRWPAEGVMDTPQDMTGVLSELAQEGYIGEVGVGPDLSGATVWKLRAHRTTDTGQTLNVLADLDMVLVSLGGGAIDALSASAFEARFGMQP